MRRDDWIVRAAGRAEIPNLVTLRGSVSQSDWSGATNVHFHRARSTGLDFGGTAFSGFSADGATFDSCRFERVSFEGGSFGAGRRSVYTDCTFGDADLRGVLLGNVRFERCTFNRATIIDWVGDAAEFVDCHFAGRISESSFAGKPWGMWLDPGYLDPPRDRNEFRGNDFREAELWACEFIYGIDIGAQRWPDGPQDIHLSRWPDRLRLAQEAFEGWPEKERDEALVTLTVYSRAGYEEQDEVFVNKWSVGTAPDLADRIWEVLAGILPDDKAPRR